MSAGLPTPTLSATIVRGAKTNRVRKIRTPGVKAAPATIVQRDVKPEKAIEPAPDASAAPGYSVFCISMYTRDIEDMDAKVAELKRRGIRKANKSWLLRVALAQVNLDTFLTSGVQ